MWLRALNHDTAFELGWSETRLLLDPWLSPDQVDGTPWFSRQHHVEPFVAVETLERPDLVVVSLPFTDHCDRESLLALPTDVPVFGPPAVLRKIARWRHFSELTALGPGERTPARRGELTLEWLPPPGGLDQVHAGLWLTHAGTTLLYAPHGLDPEDARLEGRRADVVITTPVRYDLPWYLGGTVNRGWQDAAALATRLGARVLVPCHHEQKRAEGLVARLARVDHDWEAPLVDALPSSCSLIRAPFEQRVELTP